MNVQQTLQLAGPVPSPQPGVPEQGSEMPPGPGRDTTPEVSSGQKPQPWPPT